MTILSPPTIYLVSIDTHGELLIYTEIDRRCSRFLLSTEIAAVTAAKCHENLSQCFNRCLRLLNYTKTIKKNVKEHCPAGSV
jgi:hypothetical protein